MKVIGIIAEYNPFHNGHAYQIAEIKRRTRADYVVIAMSGDFVQRGAPAVIDKYARTQMALSCGADLVVELPVLWATASAEDFAMAGVTLFEKMGCVDGICFGAETDDFALLSSVARVLVEEPSAYREALSHSLKKGLNFPSARAAALCAYLRGLGDAPDSLDNILASPNNILAIEYLKALQRRGSSMTPYVIRREGAGYHATKFSSDTLSPNSSRESSYGKDSSSDYTTDADSIIASASGIRSAIFSSRISGSDSDSISALRSAMPQEAFSILASSLKQYPPMDADVFSSILYYLLLLREKDGYAHFADAGTDISNRIAKNIRYFSSFSGFCEKNKSRNITYTRMSRVLTHILLNITTEDLSRAKNADYIPYLRILGFRKAAVSKNTDNMPMLLAAVKQYSSVPLVSKLADASGSLDEDALWMLDRDIFASNLYAGTRLGLSKCTYPKVQPPCRHTNAGGTASACNSHDCNTEVVPPAFYKNEYQRSPVLSDF